MREVKIHFQPNAWDQLMWFTKNDRKSLSKIVEIIDSICKAPFEGIGKPEPLKGDLSGYWE